MKKLQKTEDGDAVSRGTSKIFSRIGQRALNRTGKARLMFASPDPKMYSRLNKGEK